MNYGFTDADVSRRMSSLGLGRPPGLQNTSSLGTSRASSSSPLDNSNSSMSSMLSASNNRNSFSKLQSDSLMKLAAGHRAPQHQTSVHDNSAGGPTSTTTTTSSMMMGKPPVAPTNNPNQIQNYHHHRQNLQAPTTPGGNANNNDLLLGGATSPMSPDPERRTFTPPAAARQLNLGNATAASQQHHDDNEDVAHSSIFSPEASTSTRKQQQRNRFPHQHPKTQLVETEDGRLELVEDQRGSNHNDNTENENNDNDNDISQEQQEFALYSVNWPVLVEVLNVVVEKLNCQLSLVDSVIANPSGILPEKEEGLSTNSTSVSSLITSTTWCKTLQQHASETLEMIDYNLRHSSFGIKDISSRLANQLDQLKNDLSVIFRESRELDEIMRREVMTTSKKSSSAATSTTASKSKNSSSASASPIDLWANGYLQRLSVAHDLTHRILYESARYITKATSLSLSPPHRWGDWNDDDEKTPHSPQHQTRFLDQVYDAKSNRNQSSSASPVHFSRYHEGVSILDNIDPKKALISSDLLLASCEQYARCCLMEYEKRMRDRYELYARASFVELNVIIPMTSQVASMQLSLDEKESNLRLAAGRAGKAEQKLHEARMEFTEKEENLKREIAELKKQNEVLIRFQENKGSGSNKTSTTALGSHQHNTTHQTTSTTTPRSTTKNSSMIQIPLSAHQEEALARGEKINLSREEMMMLLNESRQEETELQNSNNNNDTTTSVATGLLQTPRTKSYMKHYHQQQSTSNPKTPQRTDNDSIINEASATKNKHQHQNLTPSSAEMMMEQVKLQLVDQFSHEAAVEQQNREVSNSITTTPRGGHHAKRSVHFASPTNDDDLNNASDGSPLRQGSGRRGILKAESPLQRLARMSSPMTPSSLISQQQQREEGGALSLANQQQQYQQRRVASPTAKETKTSLLRSARNEEKILLQQKKDEALLHGRMQPTQQTSPVRTPRSTTTTTTTTTATTGNSSQLQTRQQQESSAPNNSSNINKLLDNADSRISQQLEAAKTSFNAMKEKYGQNNKYDDENKLQTAITTMPITPRRGSSLGVNNNANSNKKQATTTRHAHFDSSITSKDSSPQLALVTVEDSYLPSSRNKNNNTSSFSVVGSSITKPTTKSTTATTTTTKLATLEQLVLEQRSELSTFTAHLKGIEQQEAEVKRKRETVVQSLQQSQNSIDEISEEELRETNDRIALVLQKIEEANDRLKKNKREVLAKMDLLSRTLRNSEREWNRARMEYARE